MLIIMPIIIGVISATTVFTIIFVLLYIQKRERYVAYWAGYYIITLIGYLPLLILYISQSNPMLPHDIKDLSSINDVTNFAIHGSMNLIAPLLLFIGSCLFLNNTINKRIIYLVIATGLFYFAGVTLLLPFYIYTIPICLAMASLNFIHGRMFLQKNKKSIAGWFLIIYGIHFLDYPLLNQYESLTPWGYLIGSAAFIGVSSGFLIHYFENKNTKLAKSEARFQELADSLPDVCFEIDLDGKLTYVNKNAFDFWKATQKDYDQGINVLDYIAPEDRARAKENIESLMMGMNNKYNSNEYIGLRKDGTRIPIFIRSTPIIQNGKPVGIRGFIIDITERKNMELQLQYLSYYDSLTGLLNRHGFTKELEKLLIINNSQVAIIVCDVDGLKLVNDTMGHDVGDELIKTAAELIKRNARAEGIIARIGGDEFCIVLPNTNTEDVLKIVKQLRKSIEVNNLQNPELPISISIGYALSSGSNISIRKLLREADDYMYREKLHHDQSTRSKIVQTLMNALEARDFVTEGHADRLQQLVCDLASVIGLPERQIIDLCLLAQFHDIGKVGISDRILFKAGPLNSDEKKEMERHCEIGYRIARSSPELSHIADFILKHHEWWNGEGYPLKLKGDEIPLECRILAIADAYDAMTNDRPYRKAMSHFEAISELKRYAGIQFDPFLVSKFNSMHPFLTNIKRFLN